MLLKAGTRVEAALVQRKFEDRGCQWGCDTTAQLCALWPSPHPTDEPPSVLGKPAAPFFPGFQEKKIIMPIP